MDGVLLSGALPATTTPPKKAAKFRLGAPTFTTRGQTDPDNVYMAHIKARLV